MKHPHYFKNVEGLTHVDVYRVCDLFGVTSQPLGHAIKKLLCSGQRGAKDIDQDVKEAIDSLQRFQEMQLENRAILAAESTLTGEPDFIGGTEALCEAVAVRNVWREPGVSL